MKKDKKILIIIICSILFLLALLMIFLFNTDKDEVIEEITTTTTTEIIIESKELIDDKTNISIKLTDEKYFNNELLIENIDNIVIENSILAYDINLVDEKSNKVHVENTNLLISIPYVNVNNYSQFKVLHIDENNNILETLNAIYENEKIIFNVNHLSRYVILGIKDVESTNTTKKTTIKNNNNSNTKKTTSKNNSNDSKEEWSVTFYVNGKVSSIVKVKNGNKVSKPKNPSDLKNEVFSHWVNSWTGEKFDFNSKIYKNYELYAYYKIIEESTTTSSTTKTTTSAIVDTAPPTKPDVQVIRNGKVIQTNPYKYYSSYKNIEDNNDYFLITNSSDNVGVKSYGYATKHELVNGKYSYSNLTMSSKITDEYIRENLEFDSVDNCYQPLVMFAVDKNDNYSSYEVLRYCNVKLCIKTCDSYYKEYNATNIDLNETIELDFTGFNFGTPICTVNNDNITISNNYKKITITGNIVGESKIECKSSTTSLETDFIKIKIN